MSKHPSSQSNQKLIQSLIELGNKVESVRISGNTREERLKKFMEVYNYGKCNKDPGKSFTA